ncbi:MAG: vWA domain-containing protein [Bilophila wadsworthia]
MKFSRSIVLAVALIFAWATAGFAAHSAEICQKRIESFNYLVDYSGSMMMNFPSVGKTKMAVAKEVIKRVNDMVPELGYQGGLYTFAPYGAVVNQGPWVRSTLAAGVDSLKDNLETFARFTPMGDGIQAHNGIISQMTPRAAVILVSDGESNRGISPIDEVKAIYAANPNVCFHVISVASSPEGQATLDAIAALNACSVSVKAIDLLKSDAAVDKFVGDVFCQERVAVVEDVVVSAASTSPSTSTT